LQSAIELGPSFHGLPFATSALLNGRTRIVTEIFSISSIKKKLNLQAQIGKHTCTLLSRKKTHAPEVVDQLQCKKWGDRKTRSSTELVKFEEGDVRGQTSVCRLLPSRARGRFDSSSGIASEAAPANK
jgi:hypothetical protein